MYSSKMKHPVFGDIPCFTANDVALNKQDTNRKSGYSKKFEIMKPIKIELLKAIDDLEVGAEATLEMMPNGFIYLESCGTCYETDAVSIMIEGVDFKFV